MNSKDKQYIFWLNSLASTQKLIITQTITYRYSEQKHLRASFFFSRERGDIRHTSKFFTSITMQLIYNILLLRRYISEATKEQINITNYSLYNQQYQLILHLLLRLDKYLSLSSYLLLINTLNKYNNKDYIRTILQLLAKA